MSASIDPPENPARSSNRWLFGILFAASLVFGAAGWTVNSWNGDQRLEQHQKAFRAFTDRLAAGDRIALIELAGQLAADHPSESSRIAANEFLDDAEEKPSNELARWIVTHYDEIEFRPNRGRFVLPEPDTAISRSNGDAPVHSMRF